MIGIIDYGAGNLYSISKAMQYLGYQNEIISGNSVEKLSKFKGLILPGVGAFPEAVKNLKNAGFFKEIIDYAASDRPLLGICLGMQLLFSLSQETTSTAGLDLLSGKIIRLENVPKIPHMGWNKLRILKKSQLLTEDLTTQSTDYYYFVHSFYLEEITEDVTAIAKYGQQSIPAIVEKENILGLQFHPEKSGEAGLNMLKKFGEML